MMTTRERFHAVMNGQPFDRLPLVEWAGWWNKTIDRWHGEGLPAELTAGDDICRHFGLELYRRGWYRSLHWDAPKPVSHGAGLIRDEAGYEKLRPYLFQILDQWPVNPDEARRWAEEQRRGEIVIWVSLDGFFWFPRALFGIEQHLYAFYDQAALMHRMNSELADWMVRMLDRICEFYTPDFFVFGEDLSYNNGPMLSQEQFEEFLTPYYQRVVPHLQKRGIPILVDSDGDITMCAPWFEAAGVEGILPLERQAGVDVVALRQKHPRMKWLGAFDKMVMNQGEAAMRAEFERLLPAARQGQFIISCDHQTPPGVSYQDYQSYLRLFREYAPCR